MHDVRRRRAVRIGAALLTTLLVAALPAGAQAHDLAAQSAQAAGVQDGPLLGPAGEAVKNILGLGGFFDDLNVVPGHDVKVSGGPEQLGSFEAPIVEPDIEGTPTTSKCLSDQDGFKHCKPAAGTMNVLPDGRILYWDALEGTENNRFSIVAEGGTTFTNDRHACSTSRPTRGRAPIH